MLGKLLSGVIGGLLIAILGALLTVLAINDPETAGQAGAFAFFMIWLGGLIVAVSAPRAGKAWRRLLLIAALFSLAMPLASLILTGTAVSETASQGGEYVGAAVAGTAIGGGLITAISGFLGFFLGSIFLVIGLLVGRDKQIIIIKEGKSDEEIEQ